jgi:hypothetical protein
LRWHFRRVTRAVLGFEIAMMLAGLALRGWTAAALSVYGVIWMVLLMWAWDQSWQWRSSAFVIWASLNSGRPAHAVWRTTGLNSWSWIWILFNARFLFSKLPAFPTGSPVEVVLVSIVGGIVLISFLGKWALNAGRTRNFGKNWERRLVSEFREIVREPLPDPHDPRFKKWDMRERFPWGWDLVQQQLHERLVRRQQTGGRRWLLWKRSGRSSSTQRIPRSPTGSGRKGRAHARPRRGSRSD